MERKMKAEIAVMTAENIDRKAIAKGGEILKNGGLVAFPTETVYGLGGNAPGSESIDEDLCSQGKTFGQSADRTYRRYP